MVHGVDVPTSALALSEMGGVSESSVETGNVGGSPTSMPTEGHVLAASFPAAMRGVGVLVQWPLEVSGSLP